MSPWKRPLGIVSLLLLAGLTSAETPIAQRAPLAVMPLVAEGVSEAESRQLTDALTTALQRSGKVRILERSQIDRILAEQGFQESGACQQGSCAVEAGKLLGVRELVVGSIGKVGEDLQLSARRIDVETGEVLASSTRKGPAPLERILGSLTGLVERDLLEGGAPPGDAVRSGRTRWLWWTAGGVAIAGATAAAVVWATPTNGSPAAATPDANLVVTQP